MKKSPTWFALLSVALFSATAATASAQIVIPVTAGSIETYFPLEHAFDAQPLTAPTIGLKIFAPENLGNSPNGYDSRRGGFIDFGENFANITIHEVWTAYREWSAYDGSLPFSSLWWSPTIDNTYDAGTDVAETSFNFAVAAPVSEGSFSWMRDYTGLNVTPSARYLIVQTPVTGTFGGDRVTELAFVGTVVPEPSSLLLVLLGAASLLVRRGAQRS